ncbi:lasso peptide biosynthesis PqqD family chaperone [Nocardia beijingensis]|uniref:lasso peptide biosynthesis PqqD family chaperone n=1 Tax=Nocardia beijingensis TaxID=95162 RepID=UPI0033315944
MSIAETDNGLVLLDGRTGTYWEMNHTGRLLVDAIRQRQKLNDLYQKISTEFDVDAADAEADIRSVLGQLIAEGLIVE